MYNSPNPYHMILRLMLHMFSCVVSGYNNCIIRHSKPQVHEGTDMHKNDTHVYGYTQALHAHENTCTCTYTSIRKIKGHIRLGRRKPGS